MRPNNPYKHPAGDQFFHKTECPYCSYEAGADAMLEGLKKSMDCCDYHKSYESTFGRKGKWVFIPEE